MYCVAIDEIRNSTRDGDDDFTSIVALLINQTSAKTEVAGRTTLFKN